jgi:hypothetical protein
MLSKRKIGDKQLKILMNKYKFPEDIKKVPGDFSILLGKPGVWACYGISRDNPTGWVCLNVGQSNDIGKEMRRDKEYSRGVFHHRPGVYKNYLGKELFCFERPNNKPLTTRERVWFDIGKKYKNLLFVVISDSKDEKERLTIEEQYAKNHNALYWNASPEQKKLKKK